MVGGQCLAALAKSVGIFRSQPQASGSLQAPAVMVGIHYNRTPRENSELKRSSKPELAAAIRNDRAWDLKNSAAIPVEAIGLGGQGIKSRFGVRQSLQQDLKLSAMTVCHPT